MTNIAWRNLTRERTRLAVSVGGVAFSVLLILILRGLYAGVIEQATLYVGSVDAHVWVAQAGSPGDFLRTISTVPRAEEAAIESVDGVEEASALLAAPVFFRRDGDDVDMFLIGVDAAAAMAWPPSAEAGRRIPRSGEIVVDRAFAKTRGLQIGERLEVNGRSFRIAGIVRGGNALVYHFAWADLAAVSEVVGREDLASYFLVRAADGADPRTVAAAVAHEVDGVRTFTLDDFVAANEANLNEGFLPMLFVLVLIALAVGCAVIGLTIYTATVEKLREYGVLKAIGLPNRRLYTVVVTQSVIAGLAGFALGTALSYALAAGLEVLVPVFVARIGIDDVAFAGAAAVGMAVVSSWIPLRPVARLRPAEVFRA